jgi:V/A-type H+/Na+-transporting ATPase subunit K
MKKFNSMIRTAIAVMLLAFLPIVSFAQEAPATAPEAPAVTEETIAPDKPVITDKAVLYIAIAVSMACGCLAAGYAVGKVGSAVMGAAAERPELLGKAIAYVGLGEGIALFGFLIALFLYTKI